MSARTILNRLAGDVLADRLIRDEVGRLIEHDGRHGTCLVEVLSTYLAHGSSKQAAAAALGYSRQSLYKRLATIERLIGSIDIAERHANLIVALELHALQRRSGVSEATR